MSSSASINNTATTASHSSIASDASVTATVRYPKKIYMDVSPSTSEMDLHIFMECYGEVTSVHIPQNAKGRSRGFAFVTFQWHEDATYALEQLEGRSLDGLILHPRWATPKKNKRIQVKNKKRNGSAKRRTKRVSK